MLILRKCRFLCNPKCGSETVTAAILRACHVEQIVGADNPADFHATVEDERGAHLPSFTFVRHPLSWYPSYWNHRITRGWRTHVNFRRRPGSEERVRFDLMYRNDNFNLWAEDVAIGVPGWQSQRSEFWTGPVDNPVAFIGKTENLLDDLCTALRYFGEEFNPVKLKQTHRENVGDYGRRKPVWDRLVEHRVLEAEREITERFY